MSALYNRAIEVLTSQGKFYIDLGLNRVQQALLLLDNPQDKLKYIHVAGTNGKGSVCAILSSILSELGNDFKVGLFTSPHIFEYTERIKINGVDIDKEIFAKNLLEIVDLTEKNDIHLTEFEILTVLAFDYFAKNKVDIVVLETGLGGRLDATNVIKKNLCSVISNIDLDHTERLGDSIEKISVEKAGIIKSGCPVAINKFNKGLDVFRKSCEKLQSVLYEVEEAPNFLVEKLALKGEWQRENLALSLKAVEILNENGYSIPCSAVENGIKKVKHPCRFDYDENKRLLIDGAHNPDGAKILRKSLDKYFPDEKFQFIFGCLRNKDYKSMVRNLFKPEDEIYFYKFDNPNSCSFEELNSCLNYDASEFSKFQKNREKITVVCGSFYMIKEVLSKIDTK